MPLTESICFLLPPWGTAILYSSDFDWRTTLPRIALLKTKVTSVSPGKRYSFAVNLITQYRMCVSVGNKRYQKNTQSQITSRKRDTHKTKWKLYSYSIVLKWYWLENFHNLNLGLSIDIGFCPNVKLCRRNIRQKKLSYWNFQIIFIIIYLDFNAANKLNYFLLFVLDI